VPPYADESLEDGGSQGDAPPEQGGQPDSLHAYLQTKQAEAEGYILSAARLIAPLLHPGSWSTGYEWCREQLQAAAYGALASELQLARANEHLARREYAAAVALLKEFGRCDSRQRAAAAVNLSMLALLEGQLEQAAGYGEYCCEADPGSPAALVSRGNVHLVQGEAEAALQVGTPRLSPPAPWPELGRWPEPPAHGACRAPELHW
jgi:tetratricopeptide (TPR) repeat protein